MKLYYILKYYYMKMFGYRKVDPRFLMEECTKKDHDPKNWCRIKIDGRNDRLRRVKKP